MTALEEEVEKEEDRVKIGAKRGNNTKGDQREEEEWRVRKRVKERVNRGMKTMRRKEGERENKEVQKTEERRENKEVEKTEGRRQNRGKETKQREGDKTEERRENKEVEKTEERRENKEVEKTEGRRENRGKERKQREGEKTRKWRKQRKGGRKQRSQEALTSSSSSWLMGVELFKVRISPRMLLGKSESLLPLSNSDERSTVRPGMTPLQAKQQNNKTTKQKHFLE